MFTIDIALTALMFAFAANTVWTGWRSLPSSTLPKIFGFSALTVLLAIGVNYIGLPFTSLGVLLAGGCRAFYDMVRLSLSVH